MTKKDFTKKHSFFIDEPAAPQEQEAKPEIPAPGETPEGYKPAFIEVKSKRVQLVFRPSTYERARKKATEQGISLNEYMHRLIEADTK